MADIKVAIVNASTVLKDVDVSAAVATLQVQVSRDFNAAWGIDADLSFVGGGGTAPAGVWQLVVLDDSDQAGALGYHDLTAEGLPIGKVFAKSDLQYKSSWSVTISHELLEMLADPYINLTAFVQSSSTAGKLYAYEVCDACEADELGYTINGVLVSDFVYPAWFEPQLAKVGGVKYDFGGHIKAPLQLLKGGYIGMFDVTHGGGWTQINADRAELTYAMRAKVGSRRERRRTPVDQWLYSKPKK